MTTATQSPLCDAIQRVSDWLNANSVADVEVVCMGDRGIAHVVFVSLDSMQSHFPNQSFNVESRELFDRHSFERDGIKFSTTTWK